MSHGRYSSFELRDRAVHAVVKGQPLGQVADAFGVDRTTLYRWVRRYDENGEQGLQRKPGSGRPRVLPQFDAFALIDILVEPASEFGFETELWTIGRLRQVIRERYGVTMCKHTVWRRLRETGFTYQKPERQYFELNEEAREEWMREEACAENGDRTVAAVFLKAGADINARDVEFQGTPLAAAVRSCSDAQDPQQAARSRRMIAFLLKRGAATNLPGDEPWATPLARARKRGLADVEKLLLEHGAR